jgi:hypothetical protein
MDSSKMEASMFKLMNTAVLSMAIGLTIYGTSPVMAQTAGPGGPGGPGGGESHVGAMKLLDPPPGKSRMKFQQNGSCIDRLALRRATELGLGGAYVGFSGERTVSVFGRESGEIVRIRFSRAPGCPVIQNGW